MQDAFCFPKCAVELGKWNWSKCLIYLTRWLYREQAWMKYLLIFELLARFTPKQILNCSSRKTFCKWYSSLNLPSTHKHNHTSLSFSLPSSFPPQMEHSNQFVIVFIIIIQSSYKENKATCWENIGANVQTTKSSPTPHRAAACKKVCVIWVLPIYE